MATVTNRDNSLLQLDIPKIVTGPLLQVLAEHMHLYISVRRKGEKNQKIKVF